MSIFNHHKIVKRKNWEHLTSDLLGFKEDISSATSFVKEIEKGNLDVVMHDGASASELGQSLIAMRDQMKKFSLDDQERRWTNEGLARFVEILRSKNDNLETLADTIISRLVTYVKANQGALFLINDDDQHDVFIEMIACYAYARKKHLKKRIALGEGLIGQAVLEKETIFMKEVPKDFVKITSGLGDALPRNIMVVPLKLDDQVFGVIEMASFELFKQFEIEFVEKLGESIAATISAAKVSERTTKLLAETQQQAEEMKSQEEEMRQNMEELSSTQEEMQRILREVETKQAYVTSLLNVTSDSIFTIDREYKLVTWNDAMAKSLEGFSMRLEKGFDTLLWYPDDQKQQQIKVYERAFAGEQFEVTQASEINGETYHFLTIFSPLRNANGKVYEIAIFAKDVTAITRAKLEVEANEKYIKQLLDVSGDSIMTIGRDNRIILFNETYRKSFAQMGIKIEKGFDVLSLFDKTEAADKQKIYDRIFKGETYESTDHLTANGLDLYFQVKHAPLPDIKGNIDAIAIFAKDVTEIIKSKQQTETLLHQTQQQAEELRAQEEELRQNMEEIHAQADDMQKQVTEISKLKDDLETRELVFGVTTILSEADAYGTITFINKKFCEISGYTKEELIGKPHSIVRHPDMPKEIFQLMWSTIKKGQPFKGIIKNRAKDGSHYWVDAAIVPVADENGEIVKYIGARYHIQNEAIATQLFEEQLKKLNLSQLHKA